MQAGALVTPNVRLERALAKGGMGAIWVAHHTGLATEVAVKFLSRALAENPQMRARFAREASAAARIRSPHVVQVFDHGVTAEGDPFIVMELLSGQELGARLEEAQRLAPAELIAILRQACKALSKAHQAGVVHRDIKPQNIYLCENDGDFFVKVLDFGIAKEERAQPESSTPFTQTGSLLGTPYYMSPEQIMKPKEVDLRADLWALAVLAYESLTGELPFDGETFGAISVKAVTGDFRPPTELCPELPKSVDAWFAKAFDPEVQRRFQSARELAESFANAFPAAQRSMRPSAPSLVEDTREFPVVTVPPAAPDSTAAKGLGFEPTVPPPGALPRADTLVAGGVAVVAPPRGVDKEIALELDVAPPAQAPTPTLTTGRVGPPQRVPAAASTAPGRAPLAMTSRASRAAVALVLVFGIGGGIGASRYISSAADAPAAPREPAREPTALSAEPSPIQQPAPLGAPATSTAVAASPAPGPSSSTAPPSTALATPQPPKLERSTARPKPPKPTSTAPVVKEVKDRGF